MFKCSNGQMFNCSIVQFFKCSNAQMLKCSNVQMFRSSNVQIKCHVYQMANADKVKLLSERSSGHFKQLTDDVYRNPKHFLTKILFQIVLKKKTCFWKSIKQEK